MAQVNLTDKKYTEQRWLAAHNAWNTNGGAGQQNQCKTITELLNYGVRGFALDLHVHSGKIYLEHGRGNIATRNDWSDIRNELKAWMNKRENKNEIVSLFFESYLPGPVSDTDTNSYLHQLQRSLHDPITGIDGYVAGRAAQETAIATKTVKELVEANQRLFAFIEHEPDENKQLRKKQDLFPVMEGFFGENDYGDGALRINSWTDLRKGSAANLQPTFMNHFGSAPSGDEWDRNSKNLITQHAQAFLFAFNGHYPNFISLDYINWEKGNIRRKGPIEAINFLRTQSDARISLGMKYAFDSEKFLFCPTKISGFKITSTKEKGITSIQPVKAPSINSVGVSAIEVLYDAQKGIINLRFQRTGDSAFGPWLNKQPNPTHGILTKQHVSATDMIGLRVLLDDDKGVVDLAVASRL